MPQPSPTDAKAGTSRLVNTFLGRRTTRRPARLLGGNRAQEPSSFTGSSGGRAGGRRLQERGPSEPAGAMRMPYGEDSSPAGPAAPWRAHKCWEPARAAEQPQEPEAGPEP